MGDHRRPSTPPLPTGTIPLPNQVGGHAFGKGKTKMGILKRDDGMLLKPCQDKNRGQRELEFYQRVFDPSCDNDALLGLRPLLPEFHGTWSTPMHPGVIYFCLEDITSNFELPCILDIKVGPITYDPESGPAKIKSENEKYRSKGITGFSVVGMKTVHPFTGEVTSLASSELRKFTCEEVLSKALGAFFFRDQKCFHPRLIHMFLRRLQSIREWFLKQNILHFFASSILFVYDAALFSQCNENADSKVGDSSLEASCHLDDSFILSKIDLRMIDFAHVFPANCQDYNYMKGLNGIEEYFLKVIS